MVLLNCQLRYLVLYNTIVSHFLQLRKKMYKHKFLLHRIIHHIEGHKGKISDFAAVEAKRCDIIFDYHTAELLRYDELYSII
jgi:hypothetical protein